MSQKGYPGFIDIEAVPVIEPVPGCRMRTPFGENLMLSYLEMEDGAEVPLHNHPQEQGGVLLSGKLQLTIGEETRVVAAGSLFLIPPNVFHRALAIDGPAIVLDVFSPIREDYAEQANQKHSLLGHAQICKNRIAFSTFRLVVVYRGLKRLTRIFPPFSRWASALDSTELLLLRIESRQSELITMRRPK